MGQGPGPGVYTYGVAARRRRAAMGAALGLAAGLAGCGGDPVTTASRTPPPAGLSVPAAEWRTDFSRHTAPLREFRSAGPGKDGIPTLDAPRFAPARETDIPGGEPVVLVVRGGEARAYPIRILVWHEIVNDTVGGVPVAVTFCPLCNTALVYDRRVGDRTLDFAATGTLRFSDLVMYDRQTESWWQQATGEGVVGDHAGRRLEPVPAETLGFAELVARDPGLAVMSEETGHERPYGENPYPGYDDAGTASFALDDRAPDGRLAAREPVVAVVVDKAATAWPLRELAARPVVNDRAGEVPVLVWWRPGGASPPALGPAGGREVGTVVVLDRRVVGRELTLRARGDLVEDRETGSRWSRDGRAVSGPLRGARLTRVPHHTPFWFALAAFLPEVRLAPSATG